MHPRASSPLPQSYLPASIEFRFKLGQKRKQFALIHCSFRGESCAPNCLASSGTFSLVCLVSFWAILSGLLMLKLFWLSEDHKSNSRLVIDAYVHKSLVLSVLCVATEFPNRLFTGFVENPCSANIFGFIGFSVVVLRWLNGIFWLKLVILISAFWASIFQLLVIKAPECSTFLIS
jgi:hypothetical protein